MFNTNCLNSPPTNQCIITTVANISNGMSTCDSNDATLQIGKDKLLL